MNCFHHHKGLGLVIGLSKKNTQREKKQVVFIRAVQCRSDGTQLEAVKNGEIMPRDVVEAVNTTFCALCLMRDIGEMIFLAIFTFECSFIRLMTSWNTGKTESLTLYII